MYLYYNGIATVCSNDHDLNSSILDGIYSAYFFHGLFAFLAFAPRVYSNVQPAVYTKNDSVPSVNRDGETITITPSQTYDIYCAGDQYNKHWYTVNDPSESSVIRLSRETTSPDVYAINTYGNVLTLQFRPFQSTHAGEYECRFTSRGHTLTPLSVFLSKLQPQLLLILSR